MLKTFPSDESLQFNANSEVFGSLESNSTVQTLGEETGCNDETQELLSSEHQYKKCISVGDSLPYGVRMYLETTDNVIRIKEIGLKKRLLLIGVVGSFTPYCWNRHLYQVLEKTRYYQEREIDHICCISTNDAYTQTAWADYIGCANKIIMLSDSTKRFTQRIGMDIVIPWIDNTIRSKRYVIYAEDMVVSKMIVAHNDGPQLKWECEHLRVNEDSDDDEISDSET